MADPVFSLLHHHGEIHEEEENEAGNDITINQIVKNCEKLAPFIFYTNIFSTFAHTHTAQEQRLDFPYFHHLHDDVVDELTGRWKMKSVSLQTSMDPREEEEEDNDGEKRHIDDGGCRRLFVWVWVCQPVLLLPQAFGVISYSGTSLSIRTLELRTPL